ncbi:MAG: glycosyltransferase family 39 protein, partial [Candidatus Promineifilaceae bacterium]
LIATLVCSGILVVFAQLLTSKIAEDAQTPIALLMIFALATFAGSLLLARIPSLRERFPNPTTSISAYFSISNWQVTLLLFALPFAWFARLAAGDGRLAHYATLSTAAWLLACLFAVVGGWQFKERRIALAWQEVLLMMGLFLAAWALRWVNIAEMPTTLSGDEASAAFSSLDFMSGQLDNWFAKGWFSFPSLYYRVNSIGILLFGRSIEGIRFLATLVGALTVVGVYVLGRVVFGRITGLLAAILLAGQHFHIHFSRIGLQNVWDGLFAMIALSGLWIGWQHGKRSGYIFCAIALGLGQYFYVTFRAMPVIVLLWVLIIAVRQRGRFRKQLPHLLLAAWIALIFFLPLGLYFLAQPQEFNAPLQRVTVLEGWLGEKAAEQDTTETGILLKQMWISAQGITNTPLQHWYNVGQPLLLPIASAIFLLGLIWLLISFDSRSLLILLPMLIVIVAGGLSRDAPASQRYVMIAPLVVLIIAVPLGQLSTLIDAEGVKIGRYKPTTLAAIGVMLLITLSISTISARFYFNDVYDKYVLGGFNTETATHIATYLAETPSQTVGFAGWPQMNFDSIQTLPFLVPHVETTNLMEPLTQPPSGDMLLDTYIFLPGRIHELPFVQQAYPNGRVVTVNRERDGVMFFLAYELSE